MFKGNDVIGKPVITFSDGEKIEKVYDILFDQSTNHIVGFLVDEGGWFTSARVLPLASVRKIGEDAVIIDNADAIISAEENPQAEAILSHDNILKGTHVMTEDGKDLGVMKDLCFDEVSGKVAGYEVSGGMFADAYNGRPFVPAPDTIKIGKDVAFVPVETATLMEQQAGGIKAAMQDAGQKLGEVKDKAVEKGQELKDQAMEKGQEFKDQATPKVEEWADQAKAKAEGLRQTATSPETREKAEGALGDAKQTAGEVWEMVKAKATDLKGQAETEIEDRRIKGALGRPVSRAILDPQDQLILDTGEIITNGAIEQARSAGVLDILLSSVYNKEPEMSKDDMKASPSA